MTNAIKGYSVLLWGSKPGENDDCWCGEDFATIEEARAVYDNPTPLFGANIQDAAWFALCSVSVDAKGRNEHTALEERKNPGFRKRRGGDDDGWRRERATEAGMLHGIDDYNDEMGW